MMLSMLMLSSCPKVMPESSMDISRDPKLWHCGSPCITGTGSPCNSWTSNNRHNIHSPCTSCRCSPCNTRTSNNMDFIKVRNNISRLILLMFRILSTYHHHGNAEEQQKQQEEQQLQPEGRNRQACRRPGIIGSGSRW